MWIKDVEVVESVDDLKTSQSIGGRQFPNFAMPDAKIASSVTKIIMNSFLLEEETQSGGTTGSNGRPISPRKTDCVDDL